MPPRGRHIGRRSLHGPDAATGAGLREAARFCHGLAARAAGAQRAARLDFDVKRLLQRILGTRWAWRLSGLTYATAVVATKGSWRAVPDYLAGCREESAYLLPLLSASARVLEFGCGLGGNTLALAGSVREAVGLDINPLFVRIARRLARRAGAGNAAFVSYDGGALPFPAGRFDLVFSIGVFERIPKEAVARYLAECRRCLAPGGRSAQYFLGPRARETAFASRLGADAYVYFGRDELPGLHARCGLAVREIVPWPAGHAVVSEPAAAGEGAA